MEQDYLVVIVVLLNAYFSYLSNFSALWRWCLSRGVKEDMPVTLPASHPVFTKFGMWLGPVVATLSAQMIAGTISCVSATIVSGRLVLVIMKGDGDECVRILPELVSGLYLKGKIRFVLFHGEKIPLMFSELSDLRQFCTRPI
jgi:hypothetical protein